MLFIGLIDLSELSQKIVVWANFIVFPKYFEFIFNF
jgi:hypothetical protein